MGGRNVRQWQKGNVVKDSMVGSNISERGGVADGSLQGLVAPWAIPLRGGRKAPDRVALRWGWERKAKHPVEAMPIHQILGICKERDGIASERAPYQPCHGDTFVFMCVEVEEDACDLVFSELFSAGPLSLLEVRLRARLRFTLSSHKVSNGQIVASLLLLESIDADKWLTLGQEATTYVFFTSVFTYWQRTTLHSSFTCTQLIIFVIEFFSLKTHFLYHCVLHRNQSWLHVSSLCSKR